jgi:hypothetical protein
MSCGLSCALQVTVYTQDVRGAGTDGAVYCRLRGANGATDEMQVSWLTCQPWLPAWVHPP